MKHTVFETTEVNMPNLRRSWQTTEGFIGIGNDLISHLFSLKKFTFFDYEKFNKVTD